MLHTASISGSNPGSSDAISEARTLDCSLYHGEDALGLTSAQETDLVLQATTGEKNGYLTRLYPAEQSEGNYDVDIIAVHGLGAEPLKTWTEYSSDAEDAGGQQSTREVNWLRDEDMLPAVIPNARIFTFNYDSSWYSDAPAQRLLPLAEIMIAVLSDMRKKEGIEDRPIVFIASSFGGLVVAQALERANQMDGPFRKMLLSTVGIVFLGSPLRGTPYASATKCITMISGILGHSPSDSLAKDLSGNTGVLRDLLHRFSNMARESWLRLEIRCFYEMKKTQLAKSLQDRWFSSYTEVLLVDEDSACIDGYPRYPLNLPHIKLNKFPGPRDGNFELVSCRVRELVQGHKQSIARRSNANPISLFPFPRNEDLVHRESIYVKLEKLLPLKASQYQEAALWGLGGSGKTQVALEFAYRRQKDTYSSVFWVHADSAARFSQDYGEIARLARLDVSEDGEKMMTAVRKWLEQQMDYLLVLDNADDLKMFKPTVQNKGSVENGLGLRQFIPRGPNGSILWTTRDERIVGSLVSVGKGIEVGRMEPAEALKLFRTLSHSITTSATASIAETELMVELDELPLAITQAAAYIRTTKVSTEAYLRQFRSEASLPELLDVDIVDQHRDSDLKRSVMRTWHISMAQIAQENPHAERILQTIVFFDRQGIPFELLQAAAGPEVSEVKALQAVTRLREFSFLQARTSTDGSLPAYELHRLVQTTTRLSLDKEKRRESFRLALLILVRFFPDGTHGTWEKCQLYLPHSHKVLSLPWETEETEISALAEHVSRYLWETGLTGEAGKLEVEGLRLRKKVLGDRHPKTLRSMAGLALTYHEQRRLDEAEKMQVEVLRLRQEVLGERHLDTLASMADLAATYHAQQRLDEAEKLHGEGLRLQKKVLGERHPETLSSMANLASTYGAQERLDEAEKLQVDVLRLRKEVLGERHTNTLESMAELALTYYSQERLDEAEKLQVDVLRLRKEVIGERHPDTLYSTGYLASTYYAQERINEAEKLDVEVLRLLKEVLGERHPDTLESMANLSTTWRALGRPGQAEELEKQESELRNQREEELQLSLERVSSESELDAPSRKRPKR